MQDPFTEIIGHEKTTAFFRDALAKDSLAHAHLFTGPAQVGKRAIALAVAKALFGGKQPASHPDFTLVERQTDPKTGKLRAGISIDQIRAAGATLSMSAFVGGWKVCVIDGIDGTAADAGNALLKTLEEPRGKTAIFLIAQSNAHVLPTIRSRCQATAFRQVAPGVIRDGLIRRGADARQATMIAAIAGGRPGRAVAYLADPQRIDAAARLRDVLFSFARLPVAERWSSLDAVLPPKTPFNEAGVRSHDVLDAAIALLRESLLVAAGAATDVSDERCRGWAELGARRVAAALEEAARCKRLLDDSVNPRVVLEHFASAF